MGAMDGFISAAAFRDLDESNFREPPVEDPRNSVLAVAYTSGTTGLPKGVELTHYNFVATDRVGKSLALFDETDTVLVSTPIGHTTGLLIGFMAVLRGAVWIITQPYLGVKETARVVNKYKVTWAFIISTHLLRMTEEMRSMGERLESVRRISVAGSSLPQAACIGAFDAFGNLESIGTVFGMTESGGITYAPSMQCGADLGFPSAMMEIKRKPHMLSDRVFRAPPAWELSRFVQDCAFLR
ncbi:hypothetical protein HPB49_010989 [Dermacentor silvarum]|uniref:Uncharacterized protein n=1 Tax=Dermacentor silvarum TaxID=543639 RepID=A0ACB8CX37_DERSI|nr:hypothetical protein HPB49_010989 [Dermacentor silvarum]